MYNTREQNIIKVRLNYSIIVLFNFNIKVWRINLKQQFTKLSTVKKRSDNKLYFSCEECNKIQKIKELKIETLKKTVTNNRLIRRGGSRVEELWVKPFQEVIYYG
jgi:hypothetical protein